MLTKTEIKDLLDLQSILIEYENNPSLATRLAIMKELGAKNYAFKIGRLAENQSYELETNPPLDVVEKEYAEKYKRILAITQSDNQPFA